jgi:hypothetical protein
VLYANVGPVLTHYDVDVENATVDRARFGHYARRHRAVLLAAS